MLSSFCKFQSLFFSQLPKPLAMAAYESLVSLINTVEQIMIHPRLSASLDENQIRPIQEKAACLLDFIEGFNYGGVSRKGIEDLERRIARAAHAAEDAIESHIVDRIRAESSTEASRSCSLHLQQIVEDMDAILGKASELKEQEGSRVVEEEPSHSAPLMEIGETAMVGSEDELYRLMDELTSQQTKRETISIAGMGGIGKTTLARTVYESLLIKQRFDIRAWATVSQQCNLKDVFSQLFSGLGKSSDRSVNELGEQLHKTLAGRRYLIVLDDIWSVEVWDKVRRYFPDYGNGSRILLTTRLSNVANDCSSSCLSKHLLDENESWKLFCKKVFQDEDGCPSELEEVGKEIVELCKGLPLSIVVIGGSLLKSPRTLGYWKNFARGLESITKSKEKQESFDVLLSSYHHLPPHLKPCFLYIGVFKSRFSDIHVSEIIKLWVAEGFLKSKGGRVLEEIAEDYLKDLIDRNLILVGRLRDNGKIKCCDIHDLLRDLCLKVALQEEFFHESGGFIRGTERRLVYIASREGAFGPTLARTIMAYKVRSHELDRHRLLRVFDVWSQDSDEEPFECVNLRYLCLWIPNACYDGRVWEIPASVSLAWNLHTLIVRVAWFRNVVVAPVEMWKMRQLRHIKCHQLYLPHPPQDDLSVLENLQTFKTLVNLRLSEEVCKIIPNIKKLHLVYDRHLQGYVRGMLAYLCNLSRFQKLESLKLVVESNWPTRKVELNKILAFPSSLNKLTLSYCQLHWDDLAMIGSLPRLEVLKLEYNSVTEGEEWSPVDHQFLRLKFLEIGYCHLRCWNAESCHFPVLEKLVLSGLSVLEEIPGGIGEISTLKLIHVDTHCTVPTSISAVKIKEDQLKYQDSDDLRVKIEVINLKEFVKTVEAEGLTIDNIELVKI